MQPAQTVHQSLSRSVAPTKCSGCRASAKRLVCSSAAAHVAGPTSKAASPNLSVASKRDHIEAQAAFHASIQQLVSGNSRPDISVVDGPVEIARLALLQSSSQRRCARTHPNTVNLSDTVAGVPADSTEQLPLSQLAFKVLLRASLTAARLNHPYLTTPHMLLGLLSAAANNPSSILAPAAERYPEAEAAVTALIDGPGCQVSAAAGAAASLLGQSRGLDVVTWCRDLSDKARDVLDTAEQLRKQQGHKLITSSHILAALLQQQSSSADSPKPHVHCLLAQLGLDQQQIAQQLEQQLQQCIAAADEDAVACEPVGFLHEEFYRSLHRSVSPPVASSYCLN